MDNAIGRGMTVRRYLAGPPKLWHDPRRRQCAVASLTSLTFVDGVFTGVGYAEPVGHIAATDDPDVEQFVAPPAGGGLVMCVCVCVCVVVESSSSFQLNVLLDARFIPAGRAQCIGVSEAQRSAQARAPAVHSFMVSSR